MIVSPRTAVAGIIVEFVHPVVPDEFLPVEIKIPDPDLRGVEGEFEATRETLEFLFTLAQAQEMVAPLFDQSTDKPGRNNDHQTGRQDRQPQPPDARRRRGPTAPRRGGDQP